jgi:hypothetical protein
MIIGLSAYARQQMIQICTISNDRRCQKALGYPPPGVISKVLAWCVLTDSSALASRAVSDQRLPGEHRLLRGRCFGVPTSPALKRLPRRTGRSRKMCRSSNVNFDRWLGIRSRRMQSQCPKLTHRLATAAHIAIRHVGTNGTSYRTS